MVNNPSIPRLLVNYIPVNGLVISSIIAVIALGLRVVPAARAWFWFIPNDLSWIVFWLVVAVLASSAYYFTRMLFSLVQLDYVTIDLIRYLFVVILMYFAGAFLLEKLRISPPIETWTLTSYSTITFFILYTSFLVALVYLFQSNWFRWARSELVDGIYGIDFVSIWNALQILILFLVPAVILAKLHVVPVSSDIGTWFDRSELTNTLVFFCIYGFSVLVIYMVGKPIVRLVAYLFRPVVPSEPSYDLYGPNIAWWIRLSIMFTIIAQFVCFFTAYFGLKLLLSEEGVTSVEVVSFPIPHRLAETLHVGGGAIVWTQLQVISLVVAFILSAGISYFAAMAIENLLEGHRASWPLPILVAVLGLLSTYCGFTMWNGSAATAEELRHAIQATRSQVDEFRDIDINTLGAAASDANAQISALERRVEQDERERLEAQFDGLNREVLSQESSYQALAAAAVSFDSNAEEFGRMAENERLTGASSLVPGYGAVARELQRISRAYKTAGDSISEVQKTHDAIKGDFSKLGAETYSDIVKKVPLEALRNDLHATRTKADDFFNIDLRPILENLEAELKQPLPPVFSSAAKIKSAQLEALKSVKDNLTHEANKIDGILASNPRKVPAADHEDSSSQGSAETREGKTLVDDLAVFLKEINDLNAHRQRDRSAIVDDLDQGSAKITTDSKEGSLYFDRADIVNIIGKARSELSKLSFVNTDSLENTLTKIDSEIGKLDTNANMINGYIKVIDTNRIAKLIPKSASYPKVEDFQLTPLALGVLKYFYLSLPLLLIQVFIDFGYTIALIFGVSSMRRHSGGMSSGGLSSGAVSGSASSPAARIVSPTRASTQMGTGAGLRSAVPRT
jgi:hypothetical protein